MTLFFDDPPTQEIQVVRQLVTPGWLPLVSADFKNPVLRPYNRLIAAVLLINVLLIGSVGAELSRDLQCDLGQLRGGRF